jgi:hypothetical protein
LAREIIEQLEIVPVLHPHRVALNPFYRSFEESNVWGGYNAERSSRPSTVCTSPAPPQSHKRLPARHLNLDNQQHARLISRLPDVEDGYMDGGA